MAQTGGPDFKLPASKQNSHGVILLQSCTVKAETRGSVELAGQLVLLTMSSGSVRNPVSKIKVESD